MREYKEPSKGINKTKENNQYSDHGIYVREDDQDWGSSGMNNIQEESE